MDSIRKLEAYLAEFPGIGPRQAKRFVFFLLHKNKSWTQELSKLLADIHSEVLICSECFRIFPKGNSLKNEALPLSTTQLCSICSNPHRDHSLLMLVSRDIDLEAIEKSAVYQGLYFVLGGTVPILEKEPEKKIRINELKTKIQKKISELSDPSQHSTSTIDEIIIATSANPEGEHTGDYLIEHLRPLLQNKNVKISYLGRGLSTGSELEYSDKETLKNALVNRK